jgi:hypothetical protein
LYTHPIVIILFKVEILVCGSATMDLSELKKVVVYDGYKPTDQTITAFWQVRQVVVYADYHGTLGSVGLQRGFAEGVPPLHYLALGSVGL